MLVRCRMVRSEMDDGTRHGIVLINAKHIRQHPGRSMMMIVLASSSHLTAQPDQPSRPKGGGGLRQAGGDGTWLCVCIPISSAY